MIAGIFLALCVSACVAIPPPADDEPFFTMSHSDMDVPEEEISADPVAENYASLKYYYVTQSGYYRGRQGTAIEVAATSRVSENTHNRAAKVIFLMARYMPVEVFNTVSSRARVGIFTKADTTTVFSEYARYRDRPECARRCDGTCKVTCTTDGRKYSTLAGLGGSRATGMAENLECSNADPYRSRFNVLVHEFAHTVHQYGLSSTWKNRISTAHRQARSKCVFTCTSYGMSNALEYFAEGTTAWFMTSTQASSGGMNKCGSRYCGDEVEGRKNLQSKDYSLWQALSYTWTNNRYTWASGFKGACNW